MAARRRNIFIWLGFVVVLLAMGSYIPIFAVFPATRDVPWVNYLMFAGGGILLAVGLLRAFQQPDVYRGKRAGSVLAILSLLIFGFFMYAIEIAGRSIPPGSQALQVGQSAPLFTLPDADGKPVALSEVLKNNRGAVLIFYRGYW